MNRNSRQLIVVAAVICCCLFVVPARADDEADMRAAWNQAVKLNDAAKYAEAAPLYEKALRLALGVYGENHAGTAMIINNLAVLYFNQKKYALAEPLYQRSLNIRETVHGKDHPEVANALNNLAVLYFNQKKYTQAEPLYQRSLKIRETVHGKDHPAVAGTLNGLANLYRSQGNYAEAEPLFQRSLKLFETLHGKDHLYVAQSLRDLANLYFDQRKYNLAEPLYQRSLKISETVLGKDHPDVADTLNGLANLYSFQGKYSQGEPLYQRSLKIREPVFGKDHPAVAQSLYGLAALYSDQGKYVQAELLYQRSLKIFETVHGENHPYVAQSLNGLANLYSIQGKYAQVEPLYQRSLKIFETVYGVNHSDVSTSLNNLAALYSVQGKYTQAETLHQRSLKIRETVYGKEHPYVADSLSNLTNLSVAQGKFTEAIPLQTRLRQGTRTFLLRELPYFSSREQQDFLDQTETTRFAFAMSLGRHLSKDQAVTSQSAEWLLNGKAIGLEAQTLNALLERQADPALLRQLNDFRAQEAVLALKVTKPEQREELQAQRRELEKKIAQAGGAATKLGQPWIELASVRQAIPQDGVLVEITRFKPARFGAKRGEKQWDAPRYVAWIIPPVGDVTIVDLGEAEAIDAGVKDVRAVIAKASKRIKEIGEPKAAAEMSDSLGKLADLVFKPLVPHLGKAKSLILSPDGELWLAPWAALPVGKDRFLIEDYSLRYVITGRDLIVTPPAKKLDTTAPLILADPDFDGNLSKSDAGTDNADRGISARLPKVLRLPGTATEAEAVLPKLQKLTGSDPTIHTDEKATEALVKATRRPKMLILATHGFFLPTQEVAIKDDRLPSEGKRSTPSLTKDGQLVENPLLRCGLLLAGCNRRGLAKPGEDDGVLTGLEIVGTDLRGTEMVVLSACETGLGEVRNGEGVAGLRQAFQLAGAESVVATLWQIPDVQSAQLMVGFFDNLTKKLPRDEALRASQLEQIKNRRDRFGAAHPYFWAAYTLTGSAK